MTTLTKEKIEKKINEVPFDSVEGIIGELAGRAGRHGLVHRELRSFTEFIALMIWGKKEDYVDKWCPLNWEFKEDYDDFYPYDDELDDEYALYRWACVYYIHETEYVEFDDEEL